MVVVGPGTGPAVVAAQAQVQAQVQVRVRAHGSQGDPIETDWAPPTRRSRTRHHPMRSAPGARSVSTHAGVCQEAAQ